MPLSITVSRRIQSARASSVEMFPSAAQMTDWLETQNRVMALWLDRLIAEGDPEDMVSLIHRQACWIEMMRGRLKSDKAA